MIAGGGAISESRLATLGDPTAAAFSPALSSDSSIGPGELALGICVLTDLGRLAATFWSVNPRKVTVTCPGMKFPPYGTTPGQGIDDSVEGNC